MSFKDIKGQDQAIELLQSYIRQSRIAGGYLFAGPEGVGKNLAAKTLAKALNCQDDTFDPCDKCVSCLKIEKNQHPDVHFLDFAAEAIKIEEIRQLQKEINLKPYEGKFKVFLLNNAHNLTPDAGNALLKILEEPPKYSVIILVSAKPQLLFKTIISRCQMVKFYPLKIIQLKEILQKDYGLDHHLAHFLAYFSEGRLGSALKLKETDIIREKNRIVDEFCPRAAAGRLENLAVKNRDEARRILQILASWFRDTYLIKVGIPHSELINFDRRNELLTFMSRFSFVELDNIFGVISDSLLKLEQNVNVRLLLFNLKLSLGS
ncbi:MAG: DNA polymerase III subunit delta' [Candidatus Omnitrophica bacterium]|nr:DNA polymerase III subunit delta' [Candidatus Omnitrophota bacterium]